MYFCITNFKTNLFLSYTNSSRSNLINSAFEYYKHIAFSVYRSSYSLCTCIIFTSQIKKLYKAELYDCIYCALIRELNTRFGRHALNDFVFTKVGLFCTFKKKLIFIIKKIVLLKKNSSTVCVNVYIMTVKFEYFEYVDIAD